MPPMSPAKKGAARDRQNDGSDTQGLERSCFTTKYGEQQLKLARRLTKARDPTRESSQEDGSAQEELESDDELVESGRSEVQKKLKEDERRIGLRLLCAEFECPPARRHQI